MVFNPDLSAKHMKPGDQRKRKDVRDLESTMIEKVKNELEVPPGTAAGIVHDLARMGVTTRNLSLRETADKWGIAEEKMRQMDAQLKGDYSALRVNTSTRCGILAAMLQASLMEDLMDEEVLKTIEPHKKAKMMRDIADAAVTLQDGHQPTLNVDMGTFLQQMKSVSDMKDRLQTTFGGAKK